jgi:hypothetical protein
MLPAMLALNQKLISHWLHYILIIILVTLTVFLFINIDFYPIPNPDVFQYIQDGKQYISFQLPQNIQAPPANPILIAFLSRLFPFPQIEVRIALLINSISSILSLYIVWRIGKIYIGNWAILVPIFIISNPIFYYTALNISSEVLYTLITLLSLDFHTQNKHKQSILFALVSFFVRYEGLILLLCLLALNYAYLSKKLKLKKTILWLTPVILWTGIIHLHNPSQNLLGNEFIKEIISEQSTLPNIYFFNSYPFLLFFDNYTQNHIFQRIIWLLTIIGVFFLSINKKRRHTSIIITLYILGYLIVHALFPAQDDRYLLPLMGLLIIIVIYPFIKIYNICNSLTLKIIIFGIIIVLFSKAVWQNVNSISIYMSPKQSERLVNLLAAEWINLTCASQKRVFLTLEPWITEYYVNCPDTHLYNFNYFTPECANPICSKNILMKDVKETSNETTAAYLIYDSDIDVVTEDNWIAKNFGALKFQDFYHTSRHNYSLIFQTEKKGAWIKIYEL